MARRRRADPKSDARPLILDAGAVIALTRGEHVARQVVRRANASGVEVLLPVVVVAETYRGRPSDARMHRAMEVVDQVPPATEAIGRIAGSLLGAAGSAETIDALVVAEAVARGGGRVLTGDARDLARLASPHPEVVIEAI